MDIHMRTRQGRVVETSWANIRLSDDTRVGIGIDITDRKRRAGAPPETGGCASCGRRPASPCPATTPTRCFTACSRRSAPSWRWTASGTTWPRTRSSLALASYEGAAPGAMQGVERFEHGEGGSGGSPSPATPSSACTSRIRRILARRSRRPWASARYVCHPLVARARPRNPDARSRSRDTFEPDELEFAETICQYVTLAYERIRHIRQLQETGRMKDEFLATLAHELRNPLAPIRNAAHILKQHGPRDPEMVWARQVIDRQAEHSPGWWTTCSTSRASRAGRSSCAASGSRSR